MGAHDLVPLSEQQRKCRIDLEEFAKENTGLARLIVSGGSVRARPNAAASLPRVGCAR
jgi:hypothetical protein